MASQPSSQTRSAPVRSSEQLLHLRHQWAAYQQKNKLKITRQRELIVDVFLMYPQDTHLSIEELLFAVRAKQPRVGYATVYRTVKHLLEAGLAASRQFGDGQTRYEVADLFGPHHDHLICQKCRLILEFEEPEIERLQDSVASRLGGFKVVQHKLELYGLCPKEQGIPGGGCPHDDANAQTKRVTP
ncbi:MAG TPA: transcriptional repressor [Pseudomonadota bacterium]|nr:transcriptional repressor [Pseudomonadota bacterium]